MADWREETTTGTGKLFSKPHEASLKFDCQVTLTSVSYGPLATVEL